MENAPPAGFFCNDMFIQLVFQSPRFQISKKFYKKLDPQPRRVCRTFTNKYMHDLVDG